jgi:hypothetical protein
MNTRLSVPYGPGTPTYKPQVNTNCRVCINTLPRVLWLQTSPPSWGGIWHCHVPYGFGPRLPAEVSSSAATYPMAPDLAFQLRWAMALPCVLWLRTSPPDRGGLRHYHVSCGSQWAVSLKHKEKPSNSAYAARHACAQVSKAFDRACKICG